MPVTIADLTPLQAKAYRIADNRVNQDSEWDFPLLNIEFTDLLDNHFELDNLGFNNEELEKLITFEKDIDYEMPNIPDEDKKPFQQMTFILHNNQVEIVEKAIKIIEKKDIDKTLNDNLNGNCLAEICKVFYENNC